MHEMSLMGDIIQLVVQDAKEKGFEKIGKIELVIGEIANALPDALRMAFAIIKEQNPLIFVETAELVIEIEAAKAICVLCGLEYKPRQKIAFCPNCHLPSGKVVTGESFQVLSYEGRHCDESDVKNRCVNK